MLSWLGLMNLLYLIHPHIGSSKAKKTSTGKGFTLHGSSRVNGWLSVFLAPGYSYFVWMKKHPQPFLGLISDVNFISFLCSLFLSIVLTTICPFSLPQLHLQGWVSPPCMWRVSCGASAQGARAGRGGCVPFSPLYSSHPWLPSPEPVTTNTTGKVRAKAFLTTACMVSFHQDEKGRFSTVQQRLIPTFK